MERRLQRNDVCFRVNLVFGDSPNRFEAPASVVDVSEGGLRVQTGLRLITGRLLEVLIEGRKDPFAKCRVVWSNTHGAALPSEAGLEILQPSGAGGGLSVNRIARPA